TGARTRWTRRRSDTGLGSRRRPRIPPWRTRDSRLAGRAHTAKAGCRARRRRGLEAREAGPSSDSPCGQPGTQPAQVALDSLRCLTPGLPEADIPAGRDAPKATLRATSARHVPVENLAHNRRTSLLTRCGV